LILNFNSFQT